MSTRCYGGKKHDWRKIGAVYSKAGGLRPTKRKCRECGEVQDLDAGRPSADELDEDRAFVGNRR